MTIRILAPAFNFVGFVICFVSFVVQKQPEHKGHKEKYSTKPTKCINADSQQKIKIK